MSKTRVAAGQQKRRIAKQTRDGLDQAEKKMKSKLQWQEVIPPDWLGRKEKNLFKKYVEQMRDLEVLSALDSDILAHYVIFQTTFRQLQDHLKDNGCVVEGGKPNPVLQEMRQISKMAYTYQNKLGLNPSDRLRFAKPSNDEVDELEEFQDEI